MLHVSESHSVVHITPLWYHQRCPDDATLQQMHEIGGVDYKAAVDQWISVGEFRAAKKWPNVWSAVGMLTHDDAATINDNTCRGMSHARVF